MSRSRRRTPITGMTMAQSEKQDKRDANRKLRRVTKHILSQLDNIDELPTQRETSNVWEFAKERQASVRPKCTPIPNEEVNDHS